MQPTQHDDINELLTLLKDRLISNLGNNLKGLYLIGSLTYGGFDRGNSDIDFLATIDKPLSDEELERVKNIHEELGKAFPIWSKRLEGSYTPYKWFKSIEKPVHKRWYYNAGKLSFDRSGNEWTLNLYVLREYGVPLFGHNPQDITAKVTMKDVRHSSKESLFTEWIERINKENSFTEDGYDSNHLKAYAILTMCRILYSKENDIFPSKKVAAHWAKERCPQWNNLIEIAENWEHGKEIKQDKEIKQFIQSVIYALS